MNTLPSLKAYADQLEKRDEPMSNGDRRAALGWTRILDNKVAAPLLVVAILTALAWVSGVSTLPATVEHYSRRTVAIEGKVDAIERNEIRTEERQKQIMDVLRELREDVKQLRRR